MLKLTLKSLVANRIRFAMTTFAVVLAVSFVVSSFVLTDGLRSSFGSLSEEIVDGTDLAVRPIEEFGAPTTLAAEVLDQVREVPGVATAEPLVEAPENAIRPINASGEEIPTNGPPQLAFGWVSNPELASFTVVAGQAPDGPGEFAMDLSAAARYGFDVGDTYDVITPTGRTQLTLTATTSFGEDNDTLGATLIQLSVEELQNVTGQDGFNSIQVVLSDGADSSTVQGSLSSLAPGLEVVNNATLESEQKADFNSEIDIIGNVLLGFSGVSLFVSIFIIYNTFAIVLSQRTRELALLRTIGADPVQLRRSVLGEAALIGVLASAIGIAGGVGVAWGLRAIFESLGAELPDSPTIVSARTIIVAVVIGVGVTMVAAIGPARRAARVPAIAALRDGAEAADASPRRRTSLGLAVLALGILLGGTGLFVAGSTSVVLALVASGGGAVFIGVAMLSPLVAGPLTAVFGWPMQKLFGVSGRLAKENAGRNPRRTATTAAALMIGLALVSMALTVGESVKAQLRSTLDSSVQADYLIDEVTSDAGFPPTLAAELRSLPVTDQVVGFSYDEASVAGEVQEVVGADLAAVDSLFDLDIIDGSAADSSVTDPVLVSNDEAEALGIAPGDTISTEFATGQTRTLTVIGIFADDVLVEVGYILDRSTWDSVGADSVDAWIALSTADDATEAAIIASLAPIAAAYPQANIDTASEFVERLEGFVDQALTALNVMVALAVIIALIGIANTLALSVFERTRELGLLRAVGMSRSQLRRMVRYEAGLVALFGAVLGTALGVLFGWAGVVALPSSVTSTLSVPVGRIALLVIFAGLAGLIAAWIPARRAGRLNVLDAING